jgi:hypothetical protein
MPAGCYARRRVEKHTGLMGWEKRQFELREASHATNDTLIGVDNAINTHSLHTSDL